MIKNNQSGQSTIEFIFTFCFGVSIIFMVFNSALGYSTGYLVHYATFMASRVYLVSDSFTGSSSDTSSGLSQGIADATATYAKYRLDIFQIGTEKFSINPVAGGGVDASTYLLVGGKTKFEQKIDALGKMTGAAQLELVSESFLGHEPTRAQCASRVCTAVTGSSGCENTLDVTLYDNGC